MFTSNDNKNINNLLIFLNARQILKYTLNTLYINYTSVCLI